MTGERTAAIDPWLLLALDTGETALFGYCHSHHRLGGLSWVLSSRVLDLDEVAGIARTQSGTLYLLGRRIPVDELPDEKAHAAFVELTAGGECDSDSKKDWLAACKVARWLGLAAPRSSDAVAIAEFLKQHRCKYAAVRRAAAAGAGARSALSIGLGDLAGRLATHTDTVQAGATIDTMPPVAEPGIIFRATHFGNPVVIARADRDEVVALVGGCGPEPCRDDIDTWSLIAIRGLSRGTRVHALGWRMGLADTWITSPITAISLGPISVETFSGHAYRLLAPDGDKLRPSLRDHLGQSLRSWGFHDIQPG